jgi:hypothetical protein
MFFFSFLVLCLSHVDYNVDQYLILGPGSNFFPNNPLNLILVEMVVTTLAWCFGLSTV